MSARALIQELPSSAKEAKALGAKYYFTGQSCQRGHVSKRYAHGSCVACKEEDRERSREASAAYCREWRKENTEKCASYQEKKRAKALALKSLKPPREKVKEYKRQSREQRLAFRQKNRERLAECTRAWRKNNPEKARVVDINKKALRRAACGRFTSNDVQERLAAQKGRCGWCRKKLITYHVDHITPISRGGSNFPNNIQILCEDCNMRKHNADPIVFARREGRLI